MRNIVNNGGSITVNGRKLHGYKISVWLSDYNLAHGTQYRPSTMTTQLVQQFVREVAKPYLRREVAA